MIKGEGYGNVLEIFSYNMIGNGTEIYVVYHIRRPEKPTVQSITKVELLDLV